MLELVIQGEKLQFEHSLVSVSKWESKYKKPFLGRIPPSPEEMLDYFSFMILTPGANPDLVYGLAPGQMDEIAEYINDPHTASKVPSVGGGGVQETVTSELIYYWMTAMKINWEAQHWHLGRLLILIQIANFKQQPEKNQNKKATMERWAEANERQKKMFQTKG